MSRRLFDPSAVGSDIARSRSQALARALARTFVGVLGLNRAGFLRTEIVQAIHPVAMIQTRYGPLVCRCGHGRLLWRAKTFHAEEPETVAWLDSLEPGDVFWDIGANVGLYSIYAAKFRGCRAFAVEPEAQNYALLVENIVLNKVEGRCFPANFALANRSSVGRLYVRYLTKGGAYNLCELFEASGEEEASTRLQGFEAVKDEGRGRGIEQLIVGFSLDDLVFNHGLPAPTHLKIDVDGLEPEIVQGAVRTIESGLVRSILVEINRRSERDREIPNFLRRKGFVLTSERSNWLSRTDRTREQEIPTTNMIFSKQL